ncbi:drug resistance transporter, EmrB/QacA subfamily [Quadrisphaera granulorum]|uniref:EmrB/QacA subfamily drug resistance transporter n=1 Tax=Quadrisphaera granulorum TaxID=317664 RepID=A0A315ZSZ7_9ACTN|nr:EmrB/QacA subfamily drug resistance transporter [Quadrisphaera granulorum]SZE98444.1 drug resistance transporter, EmrB/QacA subfamily [Quadrisphaera granulorum]
MVVGLDTTVLNVALPTISAELRAGTEALQWVVDAYLLAVIAVMLPAGRLGDRFGHRRALLVGLFVFGVGSVASALSTSVGELITARAVQGAGAAVLVPLALAIVTTEFPQDQRARALGLLTSAVALGLPLGPLVGGALLARWSWASVFWVNVPVVVLAIATVVVAVPVRPGRRDVRLDAIGVVASAVGLVSLVGAVIQAPSSGWTSPRTLVLVAVALAAMAAFAANLRRSRHPLVDVALFGDRRFCGGVVAVAGASAVLLAVLFVLPQLLQGVRGFDAPSAALRLLPLMVGLLVAGAAGARLQRAWGTRTTAVAGLLVLAAGAGGLAAAGPEAPQWLFAGLLTITGSGIGAAVSTAMDAAMSTVPDTAAAAGSALINTLRQISGALAVAALGSLLAATYANHLRPAVAGLPPSSRGLALGSLSGAGALHRLGLEQAAASAFTTGVGAVLLACSGLALACAATTWMVLPSTRVRPPA